ncbi:hypothetical protein GCM10022237_15830 [Nocardioides ginsengisoli]
MLALLAFAGCTERPIDKLNHELADREAKVPSCEATDCTAEVAVLAKALTDLPGVVRVEKARYREKQITDGASVLGYVVVAAGVDCDALEERAAELGWKSSVSPLSSLHLQCGAAAVGGVEPARKNLFATVRPTSQAQLKAWGDRGTLP